MENKQEFAPERIELPLNRDKIAYMAACLNKILEAGPHENPLPLLRL